MVSSSASERLSKFTQDDLDALDLDWPALFRLAYPGSSKDKTQKPADELEEKILAVLRRYGIVPKQPSEDE